MKTKQKGVVSLIVVVLVLIMASAVLVGCNNSYNGNGNGNGNNGVPPIDEPCEYCDDDTRPTTAERNKAGLQELVDGWIYAEKCVCYNSYGWNGLQAAIGMAQKVLDSPVSNEQIEVAVDLFVETVGWLPLPSNAYPWFLGFSDRFFSVSMTKDASQGGREFGIYDFPELELSYVQNSRFNTITLRKSLVLHLVEPCGVMVLYNITLLLIRLDVYSANPSFWGPGN